MLCLVPSSSKVSNLSLRVGGLAGALVYKYGLACHRDAFQMPKDR